MRRLSRDEIWCLLVGHWWENMGPSFKRCDRCGRIRRRDNNWRFR